MNRLVHVDAPHFCAGFESDGIVRRAAPILKRLVGMTDDEARAYVQKMGWKAYTLPPKHCGDAAAL